MRALSSEVDASRRSRRYLGADADVSAAFADYASGRSALVIPDTEISARIIFFSDRTSLQRMSWLHHVVASLDVIPVREEIELCLAQSDRQYDCIILHGRDFRRMKQAVKRIHKLMPHKLLYCLLDELDGNETAELLSEGADDVFSLTMCPDEGMARVRSGYRRRMGVIDQQVDLEDGALQGMDLRTIKKIEADIPLERLRRRERDVFRLLLSNAGRVVSYESLEKVIFRSDLNNRERKTGLKHSLRVCMSRIRAILPDNIKIYSRNEEGYDLHLI